MITTIATILPLCTNLIGALFLATLANKTYSNRLFLSLFMFNSAVLFTGHLLYFHNYVELYQYYDFLFLFSLLAFFPLYYVYVKSVFDFRVQFRRYLPHFLPAMLVSVVVLALSLTTDYSDFSIYFYKMAKHKVVAGQISGSLFLIYRLVLLMHTIQIIMRIKS